MAKSAAIAAVAGYVTNVLLIAGTDQVLSRLVPAETFLAADVVTQCVIQIACGYLCSRIANVQRLIATVILIL